MKRALVEVSQYYKKIANIAASYKQEADGLMELAGINEWRFKTETTKRNELINENQNYYK